MPYVEHFRVEESLVVTGTGAVTTGATPVAGSQTFADAAAVGDTFPLWIVDTTTSPPTIEASLGTYTAANTVSRTLVPGGSPALVTFAGNACSVFIARIPGGNSAQTLSVAAATLGSHAVNLGQGHAAGFLPPNINMVTIADFNAAPAGYSFFNAATLNLPVAGIKGSVLTWSDGTDVVPSISYSIYQLVTSTGGRVYSRSNANAGGWGGWTSYAFAGGDYSQVFHVATAIAATQAVPLAQAQAAFAALAGLSTQRFYVAAAIVGGHAVNLTQADGRYPKLVLSLPAATDLNTVLTSGFYNTAALPTNGPTGADSYSQMIVSSNGGKVSQTISLYLTGAVYHRTIDVSGGTSTPWENLVNLAQAQAAFAPIAQNNAPVDRLAAGDVALTTYTNSTARTWVDSITQNSSTLGVVTISGVGVATVAAGMFGSFTIPPGGSIYLAVLPARWIRQII